MTPSPSTHTHTHSHNRPLVFDAIHVVRVYIDCLGHLCRSHGSSVLLQEETSWSWLGPCRLLAGQLTHLIILNDYFILTTMFFTINNFKICKKYTTNPTLYRTLLLKFLRSMSVYYTHREQTIQLSSWLLLYNGQGSWANNTAQFLVAIIRWTR